MVGVFFADVLYPKIVDDEGKIDVLRRVLPKGGGSGYGGIAKLGKVELEVVIRTATCMFQTRHAFANFHLDPAVGGNVVEVVLLYNLLGDNF